MLSSCFKLIPPSVKQLYPGALAKQHDLKIKDLETGCGVSVGYLSRLRQGEKNIAPGADFLLAVSERLSVSVDMLLSSEISEATESENEMLQYIDKLTRETRSRKLAWQEDFGGYLETAPVNPDGTSPHPLLSVIQKNDNEPKISYHSMFHPGLFDLVPVKVYGCVFPNQRTLYLIHVWNTGDNPESPEDWTELDLVMTGPEFADPIPLGHTNHERTGRLDTPMLRLWEAVEDAAILPMLTAEAHEIFRDYLDTDSDEERNAHGTLQEASKKLFGSNRPQSGQKHPYREL